MTLATSPRRVYPYYKYPCISNYSSLSVPSCLHLFRVSHTGPFSARQTSRTFYSQVTEFARNTITKRGWIEYTTRCDFFGANERVKPPIMPQLSSRNIYTQLRYRSCHVDLGIVHYLLTPDDASHSPNCQSGGERPF